MIKAKLAWIFTSKWKKKKKGKTKENNTRNFLYRNVNKEKWTWQKKKATCETLIVLCIFCMTHPWTPWASLYSDSREKKSLGILGITWGKIQSCSKFKKIQERSVSQLFVDFAGEYVPEAFRFHLNICYLKSLTLIKNKEYLIY